MEEKNTSLLQEQTEQQEVLTNEQTSRPDQNPAGKVKTVCLQVGRFVKNFFSVNRGTKLLSVLLAIFIWLTITLNTNTEMTRTLSEIPVAIDLTGTAVGKLGLNVVSISHPTLQVTLKGKREQVASLSPEMVSLSYTINDITAPGTYEIKVSASLPNGFRETEITQVHPATLTVRFDTVDKKTVPVVVDYSEVKIASGLVCMPPEPTIQEVVLRGPTDDLAKVTQAVAKLTTDQELLDSKDFTVPLSFRNESGVEADTTYLVAEQEEVGVLLPVYKTKRVPLKVLFTGGLPQAQLEALPYQLNYQQIELAGPSDTIDGLSELVVATVDLSELDLSVTKTFPLELPSGVVSMENITQVEFVFHPANWTKRTFNVRQFNVTNVPVGKKVRVLNQILYNVQVIGPAKTVGALTYENLSCSVDFLDKSLTVGKWNYPGNINVTGEMTFAISSHQVTVQVSE